MTTKGTPSASLQLRGDEPGHPEIRVHQVVALGLALAEAEHVGGELVHEWQHLLLGQEGGRAGRHVHDTDALLPFGDLRQAGAVPRVNTSTLKPSWARCLAT